MISPRQLLSAGVVSLLLCVMFTPAAAGEFPLNPDVEQANVEKTICVPGWAKGVRPESSYTRRIKAHKLISAGIPLSRGGLYELDHTIPIELGGSPTDPSNLSLQLWSGPDGAHAKDLEEDRLHKLVCEGKVPLLFARHCMWEDWHSCAILK